MLLSATNPMRGAFEPTVVSCFSGQVEAYTSVIDTIEHAEEHADRLRKALDKPEMDPATRDYARSQLAYPVPPEGA